MSAVTGALLLAAALAALPGWWPRRPGRPASWLWPGLAVALLLLAGAVQSGLLAMTGIAVLDGSYAAAPDGVGVHPLLPAVVAVAASVAGGGPFTAAVLDSAARETGRRPSTVPAPGSPGRDRTDDGTASADTACQGTASEDTAAPPAVPAGDGPVQRPGRPRDAADVLRGGAWIGAMERAAVTATLLVAWPEGLAVVLAVKGLGRYTELSYPGAAERFIVGTFASVLWACACAGIAVLAPVP